MNSHKLAFLLPAVATGLAFASLAYADDVSTKLTKAPSTPPEILGRLHEINQQEIDLANVAAVNAYSKEVRDFAKDLIKHHQDLDHNTNEKARDMKLATLLPTRPQEEITKSESTLTQLRGMRGTEFDRFFLNTIQSDQGAGLQIMTLAREKTANKELGEFIKKNLPMFQDHQKTAIELIDKLSQNKLTPST